MKKIYVAITMLLAIGTICFAKTPLQQPSNKSPKFQKQMKQLKNRIAKYESKTKFYQKKATKYQDTNKKERAKAYSNLADANIKLVEGLKTMYESKKSFILAQKKVLDVGTAFIGKEEGNAAMFPTKKTTIENRINSLNKCIEMYDKQGSLTKKNGGYTQGVDYEALGKAVKEQVVGLETVSNAQKEIKSIKTKISKYKKKTSKTANK